MINQCGVTLVFTAFLQIKGKHPKQSVFHITTKIPLLLKDKKGSTILVLSPSIYF